MALSFTRISWLWLGGKEKEQVSNGSVINSVSPSGDWGLGLRSEAENLKFHSVKEVDRRVPPSKVRRKWKSREERGKRIEKEEYDLVMVPSDGVCLSGSESDESDWSIGWLEPHAPGFQSEDDVDGSFAVLVPCYRHDYCTKVKEDTSNPFLNGINYSADGAKYMEQWLSALHKF